MIHGTVVGLQARVNVVICPPERSNLEIEFVLDTGFKAIPQNEYTKALIGNRGTSPATRSAG